MTLFLILSVLAAIAIANEDENKKAFGTEWQFEENKYCSAGGKLKKLTNSSWKKAATACTKNAECTMVVRLKCEKTKTFYLCKGVSKPSPPKWGSCARYNLKRYTGDE